MKLGRMQRGIALALILALLLPCGALAEEWEAVSPDVQQPAPELGEIDLFQAGAYAGEGETDIQALEIEGEAGAWAEDGTPYEVGGAPALAGDEALAAGNGAAIEAAAMAAGPSSGEAQFTPRGLTVAEVRLGVKEKYTLYSDVPLASLISQNTRIATVTPEGVIKARKKGTTVIVGTAYDGTQSFCTVKVLKAPDKLTLKPSKLSMNANEERQLTAKLPGKTASGITYTSSNANVAVVGADGRVVAVGPGKATITAKTFNGKKATCKVTVERAKDYSVNYRALLIGEANFPGIGAASLPGKKDVSLMKKMLKSVKGPLGNPWTVTTRVNRTDAEIFYDIQTAFAGATERDVSLFYISTHGNEDTTYWEDYYNAGCLTTYPDASGRCALSLHRLASWLYNVPGQVIVLIDSCGSGAAIYTPMGQGGGAFDAAAFDQSVIDAFADMDKGVLAPGDTSIGAFVLTNKFYVMTAAAYLESGWSTDKNSLFAQWMTDAVRTKGKMPADSDKDKCTTLNEWYRYVTKQAKKQTIRYAGRKYKQHVQVYPADSGFELFYRK